MTEPTNDDLIRDIFMSRRLAVTQYGVIHYGLSDVKSPIYSDKYSIQPISTMQILDERFDTPLEAYKALINEEKQ